MVVELIMIALKNDYDIECLDILYTLGHIAVWASIGLKDQRKLIDSCGFRQSNAAMNRRF